ncbi:MAG: hypothetical protein QM709_04725 [Spongiibacteraceae bacterium]
MLFSRPILLALLCAASIAGADTKPLTVGDASPSLSVKDQFDKPIAIDAQTQLLLFSNSMDASKLVTEAMTATTPICQKSDAIRYFADIAKMPGLIAKTFAVPKMRERPFRIGLIWESETAAAIPRQEKQVTLIAIENGSVARIQFAADKQAIEQAIASVCPPPTAAY